MGIVPVFKRVDTCAAEFESFTPYHVFDLRGRGRGGADFEEEGHDPWLRVRIASGRESNSTTAAAMRRLRCAMMDLKPSW